MGLTCCSKMTATNYQPIFAEYNQQDATSRNLFISVTPLGRPMRRWVDNIRMDLQEVGCGYMDWIGLAQDRDRWRTLVSMV